MPNITADITVTIHSDTLFQISIAGEYKEITVKTPRILDAFENEIGEAKKTNSPLAFKIKYFDTPITDVIIRFPALSISADCFYKNYSKFDKTFTAIRPSAEYTFPPTTEIVNFHTGIPIEIKTSGPLSSRTLPVQITTIINLDSKDATDNIELVNKELVFTTLEMYAPHCEKITILPSPAVASIGQAIIIEVLDDPYVIQTPQVLVYSIQSSVTPLSISNPISKIVIPEIQNDVYSLAVITDDINPNFALNTFNGPFSIDSQGKITKDSGTLEGSYLLEIEVTDVFGGSANLSILVCVVDVLSPEYIKSVKDPCDPPRQIDLALKICCPEEEIKCLDIGYCDIQSLREVILIILHIICFIIQYTINPDFKTDISDIPTVAGFFINDTLEGYTSYLKSKFPTLIATSRLERKIEFFANLTFSFFKGLVEYFLYPTNDGKSFILTEEECLHFCIKVQQK